MSLEDIIKGINPDSEAFALGMYGTEELKFYLWPKTTYYNQAGIIPVTDDAVELAKNTSAKDPDKVIVPAGTGFIFVSQKASEGYGFKDGTKAGSMTSEKLCNLKKGWNLVAAPDKDLGAFVTPCLDAIKSIYVQDGTDSFKKADKNNLSDLGSYYLVRIKFDETPVYTPVPEEVTCEAGEELVNGVCAAAPVECTNDLGCAEGLVCVEEACEELPQPSSVAATFLEYSSNASNENYPFIASVKVDWTAPTETNFDKYLITSSGEGGLPSMVYPAKDKTTATLPIMVSEKGGTYTIKLSTSNEAGTKVSDPIETPVTLSLCSCAGRYCGDDGCGTSCGTCPEGLVCSEKKYQSQCEFPAKVGEACDETTVCTAGLVCNATTKVCEATPVECTDTSCATGQVCNATTKLCETAPECTTDADCSDGEVCNDEKTCTMELLCGNGKLDEGEVCDFGMTGVTNCKNNILTAVNISPCTCMTGYVSDGAGKCIETDKTPEILCGNGKLDKGEDCDFGMTGVTNCKNNDLTAVNISPCTCMTGYGPNANGGCIESVECTATRDCAEGQTCTATGVCTSTLDASKFQASSDNPVCDLYGGCADGFTCVEDDVCAEISFTMSTCSPACGAEETCSDGECISQRQIPNDITITGNNVVFSWASASISRDSSSIENRIRDLSGETFVEYDVEDPLAEDKLLATLIKDQYGNTVYEKILVDTSDFEVNEDEVRISIPLDLIANTNITGESQYEVEFYTYSGSENDTKVDKSKLSNGVTFPITANVRDSNN
jgi:hypothetical protein